MNGTLISVQLSTAKPSTAQMSLSANSFIALTKMENWFSDALPNYSGARKDDMVIGADNVAFATRGNSLSRLVSSAEKNCGAGSPMNQTSKSSLRSPTERAWFKHLQYS
jgi:hypothetical protein